MTLSASFDRGSPAVDVYHTDDDDDDSSSASQLLREDIEAFYYDRASVGLHATAPDTRASQHLEYPFSKHSQFTLHTPLPITSEYVDPFIAVKEMLWLLPNINDIVTNTLGRMEKAFAYNSVYFLKVILDLQSLYLPRRPELQPETILDENLVLKIAGVLSGRLTRKEDDSTSLSRELQLRTLISALSLLYQLNIGKLDGDTYAKLLRDVTERDAGNEARQVNDDTDNFRIGENEFLTRYACDLIRCLPNDLPPVFKDLNQEAIHFIFAAGFINQLKDQPSKKTLDAVFARITAAPSQWHKDMRHLYEGTAGAISLHHQAKSNNPTKTSQYASILAGDVARSITERLNEQLEIFGDTRSSLDGARQNRGPGISWIDSPMRDVEMVICGLLDLLSQLVSTFPTSNDIVGSAKELALRLIQDSDSRAFRYKAFEIIICSTLGVGEKEYYDTMRNLELEIEETSRASGTSGARSEEQNQKFLNRVKQLKIEKREAMDRCEKRNVLSTGAAESMQRRLQGNSSGGKTLAVLKEAIHIKTSWDNDEVRPSSPVPSSLPSQALTLASVGQSCESISSDSLTPTRERPGTVYSPTNSTTCKSPVSPTNTWETVFSPEFDSRSRFPDDSPVIPSYSTPTIPRKLPDAFPDTDVNTRRDMSQLFSPGFSLFEEAADDDDRVIPNKQRIMSVDLPIQDFPSYDDTHQTTKQVQDSGSRKMAHGLLLQNISNQSNETLSSFDSDAASQALVESSPTSTYAEPSLTRAPSTQTHAGSIRRRSRVFRTGRAWSLQLDKPLPPVVDSERPKQSIIAENAPEPVRELPRAEPVGRSQSAMGVRDKRPRNHSVQGLQVPLQPCFTPLPQIADIGVEHVPGPTMGPIADYELTPIETAYRFHTKDSCFRTFISTDTEHAVFLSPHNFQVFSIPTPDQIPQLKPKFQYRLGDWEGLKKSKVNWQYKTAAVSDRYVVTITKERLQVHDLADECHLIYNDLIKGWEYSTVDIAANKLVVGLSKGLKGEDIGMVRIYRMNAHTYGGHRYERFGKDIHLPINLQKPQDAPSILTLSRDGNFVTCGTPRFGYYFSWDISRIGEPRLLSASQLKRFEGPDAEILTGVTLFPDAQHLFCTTFPATVSKNELGGSFTESMYCGQTGIPTQRAIRQVSLRITASAISPYGDACAFLSKNGTVWITPVVFLEGDDNLTSFAPLRSRDRLQIQNTPDSSGKIVFSPGGERLYCVDRKGKLLMLSFPLRQQQRQSMMPPLYIPELLPQPLPSWAIKSEVGGYF